MDRNLKKSLPSESVCIFGEVLFDDFPDGKRVLGGAPFNVAWHLQALGQSPRFISRVGNDSLGRAIREAMEAWGLSTSSLQTDSNNPTGTVRVLIEAGEPSYEIVPERAYDFISPKHISDEAPCSLLYHGTLALRNQQSASTLAQLKRNHRGKIFMDVNLRAPWWNNAQVMELLSDAHWVKLNEHELRALHPDRTDPINTAARWFQETHELQLLVVTRGAGGAIALGEEQELIEVVPAGGFEVVDTVGAGDAFAAVLLLGLTLKWSLPATMDRAQVLASALVGQRGATVNDENFYRTFIEAWKLS